MDKERIQTSEDDLYLRDAAPTDGPFVLWLEEVCMKGYAVALWGEWLQSATWDKIDLTDHKIIELQGQAVGCVATTRFEDCLRVNKLYLSPDYQNRGIGANVLKKIIEKARHLGIPIRLSVLTTNPALKFYLREGFSVEAETAERRTLVMKLDSQSDI